MTSPEESIETSPIRDFDQFRRMLEAFGPGRRSTGKRDTDAWSPPTDVFETERHVVIKMALPGVKTKNLCIEFNRDVLTVCGYRERGDHDPIVSYHQMEIRNGYFERQIRIRSPFDAQQATCRYDNGFLEILLPKTREPVHRVLAIKLNF